MPQFDAMKKSPISKVHKAFRNHGAGIADCWNLFFRFIFIDL